RRQRCGFARDGERRYRRPQLVGQCIQEEHEVSLTVIAEKATIEIGGEYMNHLKYQSNGGFTLPEVNPGSANDYGYYQGSMSNHDKLYENMIRAMDDPTHPITIEQDGLRTVELIERIYNCLTFGNN